ncbi:MAG: Fe2+-dependent dioxygenase [Pseudomonadota bacterium]
MLLTISGVLSLEDLALIRGLLDGVTWRDGRETAGSTARQVKQNSQADLTTGLGQKIEHRLIEALQGHLVLKAAAQPARFSKLIVSKTEAGGGYGYHIDNVFMGDGGQSIRTDLSFTLFLSDPSDYGGGELVIEHAGQTHEMKARAGDLVLYPSTSIHSVSEVTSGSRMVCAGWIESRIQRPDDRELVFDLINLRADLADKYDAQSPEMLILGKTIANMLRRFS